MLDEREAEIAEAQRKEAERQAGVRERERVATEKEEARVAAGGTPLADL